MQAVLYIPVRNICILREAAWGNCRLPPGQEEMYFRQERVTSSCLLSPLPECKNLAAHLAESSERSWGLLVSPASRRASPWNSQGKSDHSQPRRASQGKDPQGTKGFFHDPFSTARAIPCQAEGRIFVQSKTRLIVPFSPLHCTLVKYSYTPIVFLHTHSILEDSAW